MVLPLLPIIAGAGLFGGGAGIGSMLTKKGSEIHATKEYFAPTTSIIEASPYQYYAPQVQFAPQTSYAYQGATTIISSPGAVSKKAQTTEQVSKPLQWGAWDFPTEVSQEPSHVTGGGTNLTHFALIAVVGVIAFAVIGKGKKK